MKFKPGDIVLVTDLEATGLDNGIIKGMLKVGDTGIVTDIPGDDVEIGEYCYQGSDLQLLPKATKLNRKLYPKYIEKDGLLWPAKKDLSE